MKPRIGPVPRRSSRARRLVETLRRVRQVKEFRILLVLALTPSILASVGVASAGEGRVAMQSADASCAPVGSSDVYYSCGNGTVTDSRSGLVWLANADCLGQLDLATATSFVAGLADLPDGACGESPYPPDCDCGLSDGSTPGEWRLPTLAEWMTMVADAATMGCAFSISNDAGTTCWNEACHTAGACSFFNVTGGWYWSSSTDPLAPDLAWAANLSDGTTLTNFKTLPSRSWPVRGGQ